MQFHPTFPRKQVLVLSIAFFTCFFSLLFYSCKKNDLNQALTNNTNFIEQFFKTTSTNKDVNRIINLLKEENNRTGFVSKLPANCGLPIWDKAVLQNKTIASRNATGDSSQDIIIPLTTNDKNISSILVAEYSSEGYLISCYTTNDYLYQSTHGNVDTTQAMKNLTLFFYMENHTFGTTTFYHIPAQLFTKSPSLDANGDRTITIADVDTIPPAGGLMPVDWVCVEYLCPICHGADPNCPLGGSWEECTPIGGNGGGSTGGGSTGGGSTGGTGGGGGGTGGSGGGTVCPLQGAWYSLVPVQPDCDPSSPMIQQLNSILQPGDSYVFQSINANSQSFLSVADFAAYRNNINNNISFNLSKPSVTISQTEKIETGSINLTFVGGIDLNVRLSKSGAVWSIIDVTSDEWGITLPWSWNQSSYSITTSGNEITLVVVGYVHYNIFIDGIGTVYKSKKQFKLKLNNSTGTITSMEKL